jgi:hypothetical protein
MFVKFGENGSEEGERTDIPHYGLALAMGEVRRKR